VDANYGSCTPRSCRIALRFVFDSVSVDEIADGNQPDQPAKRDRSAIPGTLRRFAKPGFIEDYIDDGSLIDLRLNQVMSRVFVGLEENCPREVRRWCRRPAVRCCQSRAFLSPPGDRPPYPPLGKLRSKFEKRSVSLLV